MSRPRHYSQAAQRIACWLFGHRYRVVRRMNPGARKLSCERCHESFAMHDGTRTLITWDAEIEAMYAPGGPLDPKHYKG